MKYSYSCELYIRACTQIHPITVHCVSPIPGYKVCRPIAAGQGGEGGGECLHTFRMFPVYLKCSRTSITHISLSTWMPAGEKNLKEDNRTLTPKLPAEVQKRHSRLGNSEPPKTQEPVQISRPPVLWSSKVQEDTTRKKKKPSSLEKLLETMP